ncbi:lipoyl(octanoyl) transferase LipB [Halodesulfovibrio sp.]|jgi:lipoyl(octanoyl) transferase|uniref:lipoyl(octanoyl) transferase LipB n=1 Tax=Halodesulfovibrio sp. TaxID=1912772 RepID=UPI0025F282F2|nr:lipoyl(octanoyl) transferase LipB [Halodesulfovibrio sp.]MCT4535904.1 lipoyl(octanoyl) transferase LipB [Halodesulfovibrio sp.]MCT4626385.1 lipoyl(octanoyl) transferase LipB [Halodesulfovibrio sp.]
MQIIDLGQIRYKDAERIQMERLDAVVTGAEQTLYLLEHDPVITFGRNGGRENLHVSDEHLSAAGIDLVHSSRGGNITCHFPGQLVAYPIFRIAKRPGGMRQFFNDLEEIVIRTASDFGVTATRQDGRPGVWVENRKICSIGIGMKKWTSYHGLALNVQRDVELFRMITLCGLADAEPSSLAQELNRDELPMQEVKDVLTRHFQTIFTHSTVAQG